MLNYLMLGKHLKPMTDEQYTQYVTKTGETDLDALFWKAIEEHAAELEVTVDYYLAEFM